MINRIFIIISLIFLFASPVNANENLYFSIQNKIKSYLLNEMQISNNYIHFPKIEKNDLPKYKLYDLNIINAGKLELSEKMELFLSNHSPPEIARMVYDIIGKHAKTADIYKNIKEQNNKLALEFYPKFKQKIKRRVYPISAFKKNGLEDLIEAISKEVSTHCN